MNTHQSLSRSLILLSALIVLAAATARAVDGPNASPEKEKELLAVLRSDAPKSEKAITCKHLAIHGSSESVPDLAKLLPDPQLSSWARIALEVIPGSASDEALRSACESLEGRLLVGTINSIGVRRDANAVDLLTKRLQDKDADVASAAAVALGHIANDAATKSLRGALAAAPIKVRSAVAEGCILCAERLHAEGKSGVAAEIYDEVRKADVPKQRIIEATRGAILARNQDGIPLLLELFQSPDKGLFQLALGTVREFPGGELDKALAAELARATPERAALIIQAMADRAQNVDLTALLEAAEQNSKEVRLSAIKALGRLGDASCLATLLDTALDADKELSQTARAALAELPGEKVDAEIVALLPQAKGKLYPLLIELVGQRRIEATDVLLKAVDNSDKTIRSAALTALGETVSLKNLSVLVSQVTAPKHRDDAPIAQQALRAASVRMPDREACATELTLALNRAPSETKSLLLEILSEVGGTNALKTLATAAKSDDTELQDTSSRLLGKWNSVEAIPVLLDLAKTAPAEKFQIRALKGYIGIARKFDMPEKDRAEMCRKAFELSRQPAEQKLVLEVLKLYPNTETLNLAIKAMQVPEVKNEATEATLIIAQKLGTKNADVEELLSKAGFEKIELEIVKAEYGAGSTQKDVTAVLQKQAGNLPLITLPAGGYNASFGGDPLPGSVKKLKIQYRINDKDGEATFAEDALIILPTPK